MGNDRILHLTLSPPAKVEMQFQFSAPDNESTDTVLELALLVQGGNNKVLVEKERLTAAQSSVPTPFVYYDFHSQRNGEGRVSVNPPDTEEDHFETLSGLPANELGLTAIPRLLENTSLAPEQTPVYKIRRQLLGYLEKLAILQCQPHEPA